MDYATNWQPAGLQYNIARLAFKTVYEHLEIIMRGANVDKLAIRGRKASKLDGPPACHCEHGEHKQEELLRTLYNVLKSAALRGRVFSPCWLVSARGIYPGRKIRDERLLTFVRQTHLN